MDETTLYAFVIQDFKIWWTKLFRLQRNWPRMKYLPLWPLQHTYRISIKSFYSAHIIYVHTKREKKEILLTKTKTKSIALSISEPTETKIHTNSKPRMSTSALDSLTYTKKKTTTKKSHDHPL